MSVQLKIFLAMLLVLLAAGVVGFNIDHFTSSEREKEDGAPTDASMPGEHEGSLKEGAPWEETSPSRSDPVLREAVLLMDGQGLQRAEGALDDGASSLGPRMEESLPLGKDWGKTPWHELVASFVKGGRPLEDRQATVTGLDIRDPEEAPAASWDFARKGTATGSVDAIELQGVIVGKGESSALINGRVTRPGDFVPEADGTLITIGRDSVLFKCRAGSRTWSLRLKPKGIARLPWARPGQPGGERWTDEPEKPRGEPEPVPSVEQGGSPSKQGGS